MKVNRTLWVPAVAVALAIAAGALSAGAPQAAGPVLTLSAPAQELVTFEPVLVTARLERVGGAALPAEPGKAGDTTLRFEIQPPVKARQGAKPLPLEAKAADLPAALRTYDLLEWFQLPAEGTWTVRAVVEHKGTTLTAAPVTVTVRRPAKGDKEQAAVDRLHHLPWGNYTTNAFCGDCFDLVKQWPGSRLARYAHYWNGVFHQHQKEYAKAIASYRTAADYPGFVLAHHAEYGIVECLAAQRENAAAVDHCAEVIRLTQARDGTAAASVPALLADQTARRLLREAGTEP